MADVKEATRIAVSFVKDLYAPNKLEDLMLEEAELSPDDRYWNITVSFRRYASKSKPDFAPVSCDPCERLYKSVKVDVNTGKALQLKIREV